MVGEDAPPDDPPEETAQLETPALGIAAPMSAGQATFSDDSTGNVPDTAEALAATTGTCSGAICYHGGYVVADRVQIYYIWYGDWSGSPVPELLRDFAANLGDSPYYRINTGYSDKEGAAVDGLLGYGGSYFIGPTHGTSLTDADVSAIVHDAITNGRLPYDRNSIYFVMGARHVYESGLCDARCAWHSSQHVTLSSGSLPVLYGFIGNPLYCPDHHTPHFCQAQSTGPNGNSAADGMASLLAHEISETVSDPFGDAWWGAKGAENGDLCAWTFGTTFTASNGATANVHLGGRGWLLQRIYDRRIPACNHA
jgi:hypothetical protein